MNKAISVSTLNVQIKSLLETTFIQVYVEGEISNITHHSSGHIYFSIKDESEMVLIGYLAFLDPPKETTKDALEAFRYGLACGSATAFSEDLADRVKINEILPKIKIEEY